jgi:large subunit ribosomal protein L29
MKRITEVRVLPTEELQRRLSDTEREIFNLRYQRETEQSEKPAEIRAAKKLVARIKTVLRQRQMEQAQSEGAKT